MKYGDSPLRESCPNCGHDSGVLEARTQATRREPSESLGYYGYCPRCDVSFRVETPQMALDTGRRARYSPPMTTTKEGTMNENMMNESIAAYHSMIATRAEDIQVKLAGAVREAVDKVFADETIGAKYVTSGGGQGQTTIGIGFKEGIGFNVTIAEAYRPHPRVQYANSKRNTSVMFARLGSMLDDTWRVTVYRDGVPETFTTRDDRMVEILAQFVEDGATVKHHAINRLVEAWFE